MNRIFALLLLAGFTATCMPTDLASSSAPNAVALKFRSRTDFLALIARPRVPLAPELQSPATTAPATASSAVLTETLFSYAADANNRVPAIFVKSASATGRRPVVIALHGTGGKKEGELPLLKRLAQRGFIAVAIDGPYHGERAAAAPKFEKLNAYETAILNAWNSNGPIETQKSKIESPSEHPFFFDTVWDVMRLVDYLQTRDDVDPSRIGLYGVSKGGIETYLTAAVDPRIAAAVPCIGVESFRWALDNNSWKSRIGTIQGAFDAAAKASGVTAPDSAFVQQFYDRIAPGITGEFDGPAMLPLIAPRPLLVINGDSDPRTPLPGLKLATDAAQAVYHAQSADDHFVIRIQPHTAHKVNPDSEAAAIDFFAHWLKSE